MKIKKSIVIPSYKHLDDLLRPCLESIIKYTDLTDVEVIVVLNGDGNTKGKEYVESLGEHFKVVWFDEGIGFTRATNEGVKVSTGEILIFMNNDVVLLPQEKNTWINYLCDPLKDNIGLTCNLKLWDWSAERYFGVFFLAAFPRHIWNKCGPLDESWNSGGEDIEFSIKVENLGYKVLQVPDDKPCEQKGGLNVNRFPSYHPGEGTFMDDEHKAKWLVHIEEVRRKLHDKFALPQGWFYGADIAEYRRIVEDVPVGGMIGELGCAYGKSICSVADIILRKKLKVILVDCFTGTKNEVGVWGIDNFRKVTEDNLKRFGIFDVTTVYEGLTTDIVKQIPDGTFDELFIDADHSYEAVKRDIEDWEPKIKKGGLISGHDLGNHPGVGIAVNERYDAIRVNDQHFQIDSGIATGSVWSKRL